MLRQFEHWLKTNASCPFLYNANYLTESIVIDIENEKYIARFTAWDDGSCFSEVILIETGTYIIDKIENYVGLDGLVDLFHIFLEHCDSRYITSQ